VANRDIFESVVSKSIYMVEDDIIVTNYMGWSAGVLHRYPNFSKTTTKVKSRFHVDFF
jgi:hypothetical protein